MRFWKILPDERSPSEMLAEGWFPADTTRTEFTIFYGLAMIYVASLCNLENCPPTSKVAAAGTWEALHRLFGLRLNCTLSKPCVCITGQSFFLYGGQNLPEDCVAFA